MRLVTLFLCGVLALLAGCDERREDSAAASSAMRERAQSAFMAGCLEYGVYMEPVCQCGFQKLEEAYTLPELSRVFALPASSPETRKMEQDALRVGYECGLAYPEVALKGFEDNFMRECVQYGADLKPICQCTLDRITAHYDAKALLDVNYLMETTGEDAREAQAFMDFTEQAAESCASRLMR
ncbi:hypothetical protein CUZ56_01785 [Saezia sanguinis]|uniref:Lipoprotein n=1 Tax=Saezia sanguinis TaxID=1965230 RepID=A0A433SCN8_9BURK|nr:hypothetical protein [Saezia sanguinis]RUS66505.1 hypothetical protein CUZ56_01785 [Saezia sanguinis]